MLEIDLSKIILERYNSDVIVMTGKVGNYHSEGMISLGASDFVEKPFSIQELILRINRVLRERQLKKEAKETHEELKKAYIDSIHRLVMASDILEMAREIALSHHEKYNGKGYPQNLSGSEIPISGRIVAIVDTFDALTSKRPYKDPYPPEMAFDIIRNERGKHFDPQITDMFMDNFSDFLDIRERIGEFKDIDLQNFMLSDRDKHTIIT